MIKLPVWVLICLYPFKLCDSIYTAAQKAESFVKMKCWINRFSEGSSTYFKTDILEVEEVDEEEERKRAQVMVVQIFLKLRWRRRRGLRCRWFRYAQAQAS